MIDYSSKDIWLSFDMIGCDKMLFGGDCHPIDKLPKYDQIHSDLLSAVI